MTPPLSVIQQAVVRRLPTLDLPAGARVLDAPCGAGALAAALEQAGLEVWGIDLDTPAPAVLRSRFACSNLSEPLPWADATFDAVFSVEGIEHLENRFAFLRQAHRILRPGGVLVITTPNIVSLRSRVRFLWSGFFHKDPRPLNEKARHPLHHVGLSTFPDLRYALHTSGFILLEAGATHRKAVSYLYGILAPWMCMYTLLAFRKEKDPAQRQRNRQIRRTLFRADLLFGENLLLVARKSD